jgi:hypothetical protein
MKLIGAHPHATIDEMIDATIPIEIADTGADPPATPEVGAIVIEQAETESTIIEVGTAGEVETRGEAGKRAREPGRKGIGGTQEEIEVMV